MNARSYFSLLLAFALLVLPSNAAASATDIANAAWPESQCVGAISLTFDAHIQDVPGRAAAATGVIPWDNKPWQIVSCAISVDPAWWSTHTPYWRCYVIVHEAGHLARHDHDEGGVMGPNLVDDFHYSPCDSPTADMVGVSYCMAAATDTVDDLSYVACPPPSDVPRVTTAPVLKPVLSRKYLQKIVVRRRPRSATRTTVRCGLWNGNVITCQLRYKLRGTSRNGRYTIHTIDRRAVDYIDAPWR